MCRTVRRGQHDEVSRAASVEVRVAGFAGLELFRLDGRVALITDGGCVAQ